MQIKYITVALASMAISGVSALPVADALPAEIVDAAIEQRAAEIASTDVLAPIEARSVENDDNILIARADQAAQADQAKLLEQAKNTVQEGQMFNAATGKQCYGYGCLYRGINYGLNANILGLQIGVNGYIDGSFYGRYGRNYCLVYTCGGVAYPDYRLYGYGGGITQYVGGAGYGNRVYQNLYGNQQNGNVAIGNYGYGSINQYVGKREVPFEA